MQNRGCLPWKNFSFFNNFSGKGLARRQRQMLLGMIVFLIICWTLSSIWLINLRRSERSCEDVAIRKAAALL